MNKVFSGRPLPSSVLFCLVLASGILTGCQWISESILEDTNSQVIPNEPEEIEATQQLEPQINDTAPSAETAELTNYEETDPIDLAGSVEEAVLEELELEEVSPAKPIIEPEVELSYFGVPEPEAELSVFDLCQEIGNKLGSVSVDDCLAQGFVSSGGRSVLGRPLAVKDYPALEDREPLGRVLLLGGIHGDEFSAVSIVFKWMEILNEHHSGIFSWRFVPVGNPDGLLAESSTRQNYNGVDLNRNFPSNDWTELALSYWREKTNSNSRRFPGTAAGSEPEVDWLVSEIKAFQPDVIISVHAPYHLVDYDGPPEAPKRLGDLQLSRLGVFPGSLGNYAGVDLDMPVVTIELPYAGILPDAGEISEMWTDLVAWLIEEQSKIADAD